MSLGIMILCILGVFSVGISIFQLWVMPAFGVLGYILRKLDFPLPPLVLGVVLGTLTEEAFRQSLSLSEGNLSIFFTRPISLTFMIALFMVLAYQVYSIVKKGLYKQRTSDEM